MLVTGLERQSVVRANLEGHGARIVTTGGDGTMAGFTSIEEALRGAVAVARAADREEFRPGQPGGTGIGLSVSKALAVSGPRAKIAHVAGATVRVRASSWRLSSLASVVRASARWAIERRPAFRA